MLVLVLTNNNLHVPMLSNMLPEHIQYKLWILEQEAECTMGFVPLQASAGLVIDAENLM